MIVSQVLAGTFFCVLTKQEGPKFSNFFGYPKNDNINTDARLVTEMLLCLLQINVHQSLYLFKLLPATHFSRE